MSDVIQLDHFRSATPRAGSIPVERADLTEHVDAFAREHPVLAARPEREKRKKAWDKAATIHEFFIRLRDIATDAGHAFKDYGIQEAKSLAHYHEMDHWLPLCDRSRTAAQQLMLTPAPSMACLNVKRRMRTRRHRGIDHATAARIDKLIDADEAWLLANAGHRAKRRRS